MTAGFVQRWVEGTKQWVVEGTKQELFDAVVLHCRKQGRRAMNEDGTVCVYRSHDGAKCGVGGLMPEECDLYTTIGGVVRLRDEMNVIMTDEQASILKALQHTHDRKRGHDPLHLTEVPKYEGTIIMAFTMLAQEHGLSLNMVTLPLEGVPQLPAIWR